MKSWRRPPGLSKLLSQAVAGKSKPTAFVLAGHNGSGKTTLWNERLAPQLQIPLINADRITASILPPADAMSGRLPLWARKLRDNDERWQLLSQAGVQAFVGLVMEREMPFAFETVFSHWKKHPDGRIESKADIIKFLRDSFALGHRAATTLTTENMLQSPGKSKSTRLRLAEFGVAHAYDHYGQMVEYLRMNGIVPPASRDKSE